MFRCPTCITVLTDPSSRRCHVCRRRIRRNGPIVLGEDTRLGTKLLPIDRALNERLRGTAYKATYRAHHEPPAVYLPPTPAPPAAPAPTPIELPAEPTFEAPASAFDSSRESKVEDLIASATMMPTAPEPAWVAFEPRERDDELAVAPSFEIDAEPQAVAPVAVDATAFAAPVYESLQVEPGPLDPDVQALVDDLYRRARSEIVDTIEAAPQPEAPAPVQEVLPAPSRRRGWVPAVLSDRKKNDGTNGNGKYDDE